MHANVNQITEGKVLDEQVKTKIFKAFRQSCFLFDETSGQCAYMGSVRKCGGSVASCYALSGIRTSSLVENALPPLAKPCRDMANDGIFSAALQVSLYEFFIVNQFVPPPTA